MLTRRGLLTKLFPATVALATGVEGATLVQRKMHDGCVLVYDRTRMTTKAAQAIARSLHLPEGTAIVGVICQPTERPEDVFALMEKS